MINFIFIWLFLGHVVMDNTILDDFINFILNTSPNNKINKSDDFDKLPSEVKSMYMDNQQSNLRIFLSKKKQFADTVELTF
jgi:hypothetical protein